MLTFDLHNHAHRHTQHTTHTLVHDSELIESANSLKYSRTQRHKVPQILTGQMTHMVIAQRPHYSPEGTQRQQTAGPALGIRPHWPRTQTFTPDSGAPWGLSGSSGIVDTGTLRGPWHWYSTGKHPGPPLQGSEPTLWGSWHFWSRPVVHVLRSAESRTGLAFAVGLSQWGFCSGAIWSGGHSCGCPRRRSWGRAQVGWTHKLGRDLVPHSSSSPKPRAAATGWETGTPGGPPHLG